MTSKRTYILYIFLVVVSLIVIITTLTHTSKTNNQNRIADHSSSTLSIITHQELTLHDGSFPKLPIYIALDGYVYDVTSGRKFYESGAVYHYLVGKDSSKSLHIMCVDIIKEKYPIIGILKEE
jgi:predicted heme/steroid binding protein